MALLYWRAGRSTAENLPLAQVLGQAHQVRFVGSNTTHEIKAIAAAACPDAPAALGCSAITLAEPLRAAVRAKTSAYVISSAKLAGLDEGVPALSLPNLVYM
jgi:hypothetical protein